LLTRKELLSTLYAIIDIETTGGDSRRDKITEIAIILHDGQKVIDRFCSLVNPERPIPPMISRMTGITDLMVRNAPKFYQIAKEIVDLTQEKIFVAHNASFDYYFIKNEFAQLGYDYNRERLCTVNLSRKLIPGLPSYGLGNLCRTLRIQNQARHRALDDALATQELFEILLQKRETS